MRNTLMRRPEGRNVMQEMNEAPIANLGCTQARQLAILVDLEARWENLRHRAGTEQMASSTQELQGRQQAYETFRSKVVAYNKQYTPAHVPELLLNTTSRLGTWCRRMRNLYIRVENDRRIPCPVNLLAKAYRWADRVALRMNKAPARRVALPSTVRDAIEGLAVVIGWCNAQADGPGQPGTFVVPPSTSGEGVTNADSQ
jgi:hypothetical protein